MKTEPVRRASKYLPEETWYQKIIYSIGSIILFPIVVLPIIFLLILFVLAFYAQRYLER